MLDDYKIDHIPSGWREITTATTAPDGWVWFGNCKSRFTNPHEYKHGLVPIELADEWRRHQDM